MKKRILALLMLLVFALSLVGCGGEKKILHCDHCGEEVEVEADSNMEEDWILFCAKCNKELGLDDLVK